MKASPGNLDLSPFLLWGYLLLYAEQGNGEKAIPVIGSLNELQRQTGLDLNRQGLLRLQGKAYELTKDYDRAIQSYELYIKMNPANFESVLSLGRCYRLKNDFDKAEATLLKALKLFPAYPEAHYELSVLYAQRGNPAKAREHLKTALEGWAEADADDALAKEARALALALAQR